MLRWVIGCCVPDCDQHQAEGSEALRWNAETAASDGVYVRRMQIAEERSERRHASAVTLDKSTPTTYRRRPQGLGLSARRDCGAGGSGLNQRMGRRDLQLGVQETAAIRRLALAMKGSWR